MRTLYANWYEAVVMISVSNLFNLWIEQIKNNQPFFKEKMLGNYPYVVHMCYSAAQLKMMWFIDFVLK